MSTTFNAIGMKMAGGRVLVMALVDEDQLGGNLPNIFETKVVQPTPNIYTGTYPTWRIAIDTIAPREDLAGLGAAGIITSPVWGIKHREDKDFLGINL